MGWGSGGGRGDRDGGIGREGGESAGMEGG